MNLRETEASKTEVQAISKNEKAERIVSACGEHNIQLLRQLAASPQGLVNDDCRKLAWPILLGCNVDDETNKDWRSLDKHRDEDQVQLDVNRSFIHYPEGQSEISRETRQLELSRTITAVLRSHPSLNYFQGYHDIVQVMLLVLGYPVAVEALARLSLLRIRDYMLPTMTGTEIHLHLLPHILMAADPIICKHLSHTRPFFALASTLTLYAHDIEEYDDIVRLFDFLLASEAFIPLYLFAAIVIRRRAELLELQSDETDMLHYILSKLPKPLHLEQLIQETLALYTAHPPEKLVGNAWSRIPSSSVLKTTHDFSKLQQQTLADGERYFEQEATILRNADIARQRRLRLQAIVRKYRGSVIWTGLAIAFALTGFILRGNDLSQLSLETAARWSWLRRSSIQLWQNFGFRR